ncbi:MULTISPECIES: putative DNA-binding protein [Gracilibacillus]|uniref:putative DNA-binding protein n=1 Tax=Gracilibacillus TaxID=74385 RepID=UPI00082538D5|nr:MULTISPECIES: putative DNA-binding protein [Gracilibacillus]
MLEKTTRMNALYDFYQKLLTQKQRNYMEMYYLEDFSLGEISESSNVSRQAIYDNIRRTEQMLENYEEKLGLYQKFQDRQTLLKEILELADQQHNVTLKKKLEQINDME